MHAKVYLPGPMEGEVSARDENGKRVAVTQVQIDPLFFRADAKPAVLHLESVDANDNVIQRYMVVQAGATGELHLVKRTPCTPKLDQQYEKTPTEPSE